MIGLASHPGGVAILLVGFMHCYRNRISSSCVGQFANGFAPLQWAYRRVMYNVLYGMITCNIWIILIYFRNVSKKKRKKEKSRKRKND